MTVHEITQTQVVMRGEQEDLMRKQEMCTGFLAWKCGKVREVDSRTT